MPDTRPTIVSLNPCTDAILAEMTGPEQLLAISHYSLDPRATSMDLARARQYRATGGTVEEVLALKPQLVVASTFTSAPTIAALEQAGITVVGFGVAHTVDESMAQIRDLAAMSGRGPQGEALIMRITRALEQARGPSDAAVNAVLWQPGGIVAGKDSLVNQLLDQTGFANQAVQEGYDQADYVALEDVLAAPPQVLLISGSEPGQKHPALDAIPGMRRAAFDTSLLFCGGPTIIRAAGRLAEIRAAFIARSYRAENAVRSRDISGKSVSSSLDTNGSVIQ